MEQDRWQRLWSVFHGALERPEGRERAGFLTESCGSNAALRAEVDALLAAHEATEGPFPHPGVADAPDTEAEIGGRIGALPARAPHRRRRHGRRLRGPPGGADPAPRRAQADQAGHEHARSGAALRGRAAGAGARSVVRRHRAANGGRDPLVERHAPAAGAVLLAAVAPNALNQDAAHRLRRGAEEVRPAGSWEACIMPPRDPESGFARHATAAPDAERSRRMRSVRAPGTRSRTRGRSDHVSVPPPRVGGAARRPARASAATRDRRASAPCRTCAAARHAALPPAVTGFRARRRWYLASTRAQYDVARAGCGLPR